MMKMSFKYLNIDIFLYNSNMNDMQIFYFLTILKIHLEFH